MPHIDAAATRRLLALRRQRGGAQSLRSPHAHSDCLNPVRPWQWSLAVRCHPSKNLSGPELSAYENLTDACGNLDAIEPNIRRRSRLAFVVTHRECLAVGGSPSAGSVEASTGNRAAVI